MVGCVRSTFLLEIELAFMTSSASARFSHLCKTADSCSSYWQTTTVMNNQMQGLTLIEDHKWGLKAYRRDTSSESHGSALYLRHIDVTLCQLFIKSFKKKL